MDRMKGMFFGEIQKKQEITKEYLDTLNSEQLNSLLGSIKVTGAKNTVQYSNELKKLRFVADYIMKKGFNE